MVFYETEQGSTIYAVKILSYDTALLDTRDGQVNIDIWTDRIVGGLSKCYLHEVPEFKNAEPEQWFTPLRDGE